MKIKLETEVLRRTTRKPIIQKDERIDLTKAYNSLKYDFNLKYEPDSQFDQLILRIEGFTVIIFPSGNIKVWGTESLDKQEQVITDFFTNHLKKFIKKVR